MKKGPKKKNVKDIRCTTHCMYNNYEDYKVLPDGWKGRHDGLVRLG